MAAMPGLPTCLGKFPVTDRTHRPELPHAGNNCMRYVMMPPWPDNFRFLLVVLVEPIDLFWRR
jgi:hypothetical protein